ncbi:unnamed protein product [Tenebrio molitor]|nr:unnamed protein product [Tenebrio molitor]
MVLNKKVEPWKLIVKTRPLKNVRIGYKRDGGRRFDRKIAAKSRRERFYKLLRLAKIRERQRSSFLLSLSGFSCFWVIGKKQRSRL